MSRQRSAVKGGAPFSVLLAGAFLLVGAPVARQAGGSAPGSGSSTTAGAPASPGASHPGSPAPSTAPAGRPLPLGLEDRGWIAEVGVQGWFAGSLSGRAIALPNDEIALTATATMVVSVRYGQNGRTSTVRVRDLPTGRLRVSVDRPGTVSSAVVVGATVYVAGDA